MKRSLVVRPYPGTVETFIRDAGLLVKELNEKGEVYVVTKETVKGDDYFWITPRRLVRPTETIIYPKEEK